jgi:uncharacterized protein
MMNHANRDSYLVQDNINMVRVSAGHSVIVRKNIMTSEVAAGEGSMLEQELGRLIGEISDQLRSMVSVIAQLTKNAALNDAAPFRLGFGPLIKLLCRQKFAVLPALIASLCQKVKTNMHGVDKEWLILCHKLRKNFTEPFLPEIATIDDLHALAARIDRLRRIASIEGVRSDSLLRARYVQNSRLYSSGDIRIEQEGVVNSNLYARGSVHIDGYARGCEIYAEHGVRIREAEARGGTPTRIRVPAGRPVTIDMAQGGTVIQVGNRMHTIARDRYGFNLHD